MKVRKGFVIAAAIGSVAAGAMLLSGCGTRKLSVDDLINMGYECTVVYDMCEGKSDNQATRTVQAIPDTYLIQPGAADMFSAPVRQGYTLDGFYTGTVEDGQVVYGERWDFSNDKVSESMTLYARWLKNFTLSVHYGEDFSQTATRSVERKSATSVETVDSMSITGYTVVGYYYDKACTQEVTFPYTLRCSGDKTEDNIYAKALKGTWQLVRTAADFAKLTIQMGTNVLLLDNIDMTGYTNLKLPDKYVGTFDGDGHTISNLTVSKKPSSWQDAYFGIFNQLLGNAVIKNVTFENVDISVRLDNPAVREYFVAALAGSATSTVTLEDVNVTGTVNCSILEEVLDEHSEAPLTIEKLVGTGEVQPVRCDASGVVLITQIVTE